MDATNQRPAARLRPRLFIRGGSFSEERAQDAVLRLVAIAENYAISGLSIDGNTRFPQGGDAQLLWSQLPDRLTETWDGALQAWAKIFGIKIRPSGGGFDVLEGFIAARNTIAHGLGTLTPKQLRGRAAVAQQLSRAGFALAGDTLNVEARHVLGCAAVVETFVLWLDEARRQEAVNRHQI